MILLLSGEGPSDLGSCAKPVGTCEGADFKPGPMAWLVDRLVPKPRSEAWLLCAVQGVPYQNCARLEQLPGNDTSPHSAKGELEKALAAVGWSDADLCDLIRNGQIDPRRIEMPSFASFRARLEIVARNMVR